MIITNLDKSCINLIISEYPYVKLLSIPKFNKEMFRYEALAQVNSALAIIEVKVTTQIGVE